VLHAEHAAEDEGDFFEFWPLSGLDPAGGETIRATLTDA